jgi:hypothetical protein
VRKEEKKEGGGSLLSKLRGVEGESERERARVRGRESKSERARERGRGVGGGDEREPIHAKHSPQIIVERRELCTRKHTHTHACAHTHKQREREREKETEKFYSGYGVGYRMDYGLVGVENLRSRALIVSLSGAFPPPILHTHAALLHYQQFTPAPPVPVPP